MAGELLGGVGEVSLLEWVVEETSEPTQNKAEVFFTVDSAQVIDEEVVTTARPRLLNRKMA